MSSDTNTLTRREAIKRAASLLGGSIAATQLTGFVGRAAAAAADGESPAFFSDEQFTLIERIADVMIPETDTPGARAVGVHHFVDLMMAEWASAERQARYVAGLERLDAELGGPSGARFVDLDSNQQLDALRAVDSAAFSPGTENPFYVELKKMLLFAYYSSETGATQELDYERLPGIFRPCLDVDGDTRAWFHLVFSYGL